MWDCATALFSAFGRFRSGHRSTRRKCTVDNEGKNPSFHYSLMVIRLVWPLKHHRPKCARLTNPQCIALDFLLLRGIPSKSKERQDEKTNIYGNKRTSSFATTVLRVVAALSVDCRVRVIICGQGVSSIPRDRSLSY